MSYQGNNGEGMTWYILFFYIIFYIIYLYYLFIFIYIYNKLY